MRFSRIAVCLTLLTPLFFACSGAGNTGAPGIEGNDINGAGDISLKKYDGKAVLLNFWATWCPPCRLEVPDLVKLQDTYKGRLAVIGISVDQNGIDGVRDFTKKYRINYPVIMATTGMISDYGGIPAIPSSFLVDSKGKIVKKFIGAMSFSQYEAEIKPFLPK